MLTKSPNHTASVLEVERRSEPRAQIGHQALIRLQNKVTFPARIRDLSSSAAQLVCDSRYGLLIDPSGRGDKLAELSPVELAFALPDHDFRARCRIKYAKMLSSNDGESAMLFGFKFLGVDFAMLQKLESILDPFGS